MTVRHLQRDLDSLSVGETNWDIEINPSKCQVVQVIEGLSMSPTNFMERSWRLSAVLSIWRLMSRVTSLGAHTIFNIANKALGFVKRTTEIKIPAVRVNL